MKNRHYQSINIAIILIHSICTTDAVAADGKKINNRSSMDGWWTVIKGERQGSNMEPSNKNVFFRRNGRSYLINSSSCKILQLSQIEYDESTLPFTGRITNSKRGSTTYFSYKMENDTAVMAFYLDERRERESPQRVMQENNILLIRQTRVTGIKCADPESVTQSETIYKPSVNCNEKKSPFWSVDCQNPYLIHRFIMLECGYDSYPIIIGNSITAIPYPGFRDVIDVYNDPRIQWLSEDKISVSNSDKDAGWKGRLIFHRCEVLR